VIDFAYRGATISVEHRQSAEEERAIVAKIMNALGITEEGVSESRHTSNNAHVCCIHDPLAACCDNWRHGLNRGIFLLDVEHDPAALQALETYAFAVSKAGDRPLCDELIQKINEVRARRKA